MLTFREYAKELMVKAELPTSEELDKLAQLWEGSLVARGIALQSSPSNDFKAGAIMMGKILSKDPKHKF